MLPWPVCKKPKLENDESKQEVDDQPKPPRVKKRMFALLVAYCGQGYAGLQRYCSNMCVDIIVSDTNSVWFPKLRLTMLIMLMCKGFPYSFHTFFVIHFVPPDLVISLLVGCHFDGCCIFCSLCNVTSFSSYIHFSILRFIYVYFPSLRCIQFIKLYQVKRSVITYIWNLLQQITN